MNKKLVSLLVSMALLISITCVLAPGRTDAQTVLKLAHITAPGGMLDKRAQKFAELVSQKTAGKVKIEIYPAQQLGNIKEILQGISMGTIDMAQESESFMDAFDKDYSFFATPFLFTRDEIRKAKYLDEVRERVRAKTGIRTLPGVAFRPQVHLFTQKTQILRPEELKGIKLRVWQSKAIVDTWNGLGATAVPLPWGEVYLALSQKVVNGMVHNIVQVRDEKFYEQLNYCSKLDWMQLYDVTWINDGKFKSLPADIQKVLNEASLESANWFVDFGQGLEKEAQAQLEKAGIKFANADRPVWVKKASEVHIKLENDGLWNKGLLKRMGKI